MKILVQALFPLSATLLQLSSAVPVDGQQGHSFTIHQVRNDVVRRDAISDLLNSLGFQNGAFSLARTYLKYNVPLPAYLQNALDTTYGDVISVINSLNLKRATSGVAVTTPQQFDTAYITPVSIGTPPQTLNMDFDTGSADLWVFSTELDPKYQSGHGVYNSAKSSTAKKLAGASWNIQYGDGSGASGDVYNDVVNIGGVSYANHTIELASQISKQFYTNTNSDGLVGLAFNTRNTISPTRQKTFFDNVKSSLASPIFAVDLKHNAPGSFAFGATDSSKYKGTISYTNVNSSSGLWSFTPSGYKVGNKTYSTGVTGVADTGTTMLLLPDDVVKNYYSQVPGSQLSNAYGGYVFPCSATIPTFTFTVGSTDIVIPSSYLNYDAVASGSSTCFGGLQSSTGIGINIYGDIALKAAYVVFSGGSTPQVGFAAKNT